MRNEFWFENLKAGNRLEDGDVDRRITLKTMLKNQGVNWINLAQDSDQWRVLVITILNHRVV
jgi:hypothetical protein